MVPILKEFWGTRIKKNCAWYAIPMSILFTWRFTYLRHIPFTSAVSARLYFVFLAVTYVTLMLVFFVLFAIAKKRAEK